ncbi:MAG: hypothetical protein COZ64_00120 [Candidatus Brennerbacteria bacterium CG_4_8_14_3_um_filter_43_14]|uniref:Uncharacterized protein n=2 Tax=Candidatus Brenneribacteriota TaxID=1817902 RepID=A0A2M8C2Y7_9BACT|nr:MAG: hypothetical protein AUJ43_01325 [Parcubacteria group bacterium CG1_02_44_31]PIX29387.1 MAG: hypothetical protein COZ64_00120 [Candidatus Brennerbacteria bacterium CG_4_8_14_3_um_filter_43_14]PJB50461.1 MAG: hypothetical protein CO102_01040 [Candidatus Brennerbacteria bacterium CG_4_9_14_3_um_filter_43_9]
MEPEHIAQIKQIFQKKAAQTPGLTPEQEKQILHEIIIERIKQPSLGASTQTGTTQQDQTQQPISATKPLPASTQSSGHAAVVRTLVQMAVHEDLYKAAQLAYDTKNPYLIDQFHDTLVDEFFNMIKSEL